MRSIEKFEKHKPINIYRGRIESLVIYEVSEYELDIIENGEKKKTFGNWGSNLLYFSLSLLVTWITGDFAYEFLKLIILLGWFTGTILGIILILISKQDKKSVKTIIDKIRQRHKTK
jgi:hypothetical protein